MKVVFFSERRSAMTARLVDRLGQTGFDAETQLRISLFPECLWGFPPANIKEMLIRFDCPRCRKIIGLVEEEVNLLRDLEQKVEELCASTRKANEDAIREYGLRCRRYWIFSGFLEKPQALPMPDHTREVWYTAASVKKELIEDELAQLKAEHPEHWGDGEPKDISHQLVARFFGRECFMVS